MGIKHAVAHAGEEGAPIPFVTDALDKLKVERLDHGVQSLLNQDVCDRVAKD